MGCASSKSNHPKRCKNCNAQPYSSPLHRRSFSLHVHHPPSVEDYSYHVIDNFSSSPNRLGLVSNGDHVIEKGEDVKKVDFEVGVIEAKAWSKMIDEKITRVVPKTPVRTPPGEPETINAWEMMEGLEDTSPLIRPLDHHVRSFSFHVLPNEMPNLMEDEDENENENENEGDHLSSNSPSPKPFWKDTPGHGSNEKKTMSKTVESELEPEIIIAFRKAMEELSPTSPLRLSKRKPQSPSFESNGVVDDVKVASIGGCEKQEEKMEDSVKERLVLYFTSLRGVRKTYEECCNVRMILKSLGVRVDERDVSMHLGFKEELKELLGEGYGGGLPRVFVGHKHIGGAEEIRTMHEEGRLEKVLEQCEFEETDAGSCEACGDVRFVPCETCSGSCKIYCEVDEDDDESQEEELEEDEFGFKRCPYCNENGLIRCPICCS